MLLAEAWTRSDLMLQPSMRSLVRGEEGVRLTTEVCFLEWPDLGIGWSRADGEERETEGSMSVNPYLYRRTRKELHSMERASCTIGRCFSCSCPPSCKTCADLVTIEPTTLAGSGGSSSSRAGASRSAGAASPSVLVWLQNGRSLLPPTGSSPSWQPLNHLLSLGRPSRCHSRSASPPRQG